MNHLTTFSLVVASLLLLANDALAAGRYLRVDYPPASDPHQLQMAVTYSLWIPDDVATIRGIVVHQHGCGVGACEGGQTAAYDLHWQALAAKWDCALLGPSYGQAETQNCRLWCDPRNGSSATFLRAIDDFADRSGHSELKDAPWCLWGHSGGGFWASLMQTMYPERVLAVWLQSGTAFSSWEDGDIPKPTILPNVYSIPVMCCPGVKEKDHERFQRAWHGAIDMLKAYRAKGAPIGLAPDPRTGHECGDSRYLAIPFFDACLAIRLPEKNGGNQSLKPVDMEAAWLAEPLSNLAVPANSYPGDVTEAAWLPDERVAKAWTQFVKTGAVEDTSPPPAPQNVEAARQPDATIQITWDAVADFESGIAGFIIRRDGRTIARIPEKPIGRYGRPLFQTMSYHDTPAAPLPETRYVDSSSGANPKCSYQVITINSVGLESEPASSN